MHLLVSQHFYHSYSKDTSPNVVCCGIRNAIPDLAIRLPKAVLVGGSRIALPRASLKHVGVPRFRYHRSPESLPKCLSLCRGFRFIPGESNQFSSIPSYDQIIPHVLYKYEASASNTLSHSLTSLSLSTREPLTISVQSSIEVSASTRSEILITSIIRVIASRSSD